MNASPSLFDEVVEASGLVELVAPYTVSRLLVAAGASPRDLTREDVAAAMPEFERGLSVYLQGEDLERALGALRRLAQAE